MQDSRGPSVEAFSRVVESIYDAAMDPAHWQEALRLISELTESSKTGMGIVDHAQKRHVLGYAHGYEEGYLRKYSEQYAVMNPLMVAGHLRPVGSVYTMSMLVDEEEFLESRLYTDWARPQGLRDFIGIHTLRSGQRSAGLSAQRLERQPRYGEADLRLFGLLSPHICRAFAISDLLDLRTITSETLKATLDALAAGVYLIDREGRVAYMNAAAEKQVRTSGVLRIRSNRLAASRQDLQGILGHEIANAIADEAAIAGAHTVALSGNDGTGLVATILPLDRGKRRSVSGPFAAAAAVFVQDPQNVPPLPGEAFAKLYGLTAGELRVLLALAPGLSVREAADMLGIRESTSKTHLQRIFQKTGTSKQTELMRLLMNAGPPVRPQ
jgi:DNA-binding CsgD family transcriptional regulator